MGLYRALRVKGFWQTLVVQSVFLVKHCAYLEHKPQGSIHCPPPIAFFSGTALMIFVATLIMPASIVLSRYTRVCTYVREEPLDPPLLEK